MFGTSSLALDAAEKRVASEKQRVVAKEPEVESKYGQVGIWVLVLILVNRYLQVAVSHFPSSSYAYFLSTPDQREVQEVHGINAAENGPFEIVGEGIEDQILG